VADAAARLPPWATVYQQTQRWLNAGCFEAIVHDLRELLRQTTRPQGPAQCSGFRWTDTPAELRERARAGYDGYERRKGSKVHMAVDTLGH
jgi:transposase